MPRWLEVVAVIVLPLAYGLLVSGFFDWLHKRRAGKGMGSPTRPAPPAGPCDNGEGAQ